MKTLFNIIVMVGLSTICFAQSIITPEQAKQAVRDFEGDPTIVFRTVSYSDNQLLIDQGLMQNFEASYFLSEEGTSVYWHVDAFSARVSLVYYDDPDIYKPNRPTPNYETALTELQCEQIASNYASNHYPNFDNMNMVLVFAKKVDTGWEFSWRQLLPSGAYFINGAIVGVLPDNGSIQYYLEVIKQSETPITYQLTPQQVINIAKSETGIAIVDTVSNNTLERPWQYNDVVRWEIDISGWTNSMEYVEEYFAINAVTGAIIDRSDYESDYDDQLDDKQETTLNLSKKIKELYKSSLKKTGEKKWELDIQGHVFEMSAGDSFITDSNGEKIELSGKIEEKDGEVIVPADFLPNVAKHIGKKMKKNDESKEQDSEESEDGTSVGTMNGGAASGPFYYIAGAVLAGVLLGAIVKGRIAASRKARS